MKKIILIGSILLSLFSCKRIAEIPGVLLDAPDGEAPWVLDSYPSVATPNIPAITEVRVDFNKDMDIELTQGAFALTGSAAVSGRFEWFGLRRMIYKLDSPLIPGNAYLMRVTTNAQAANGSRIPLEYIVHFTVGSTIQSPEIVATDPAGSAQGVPTTTAVSVTFSRPMNTASVESAFSISPSVPGVFTWDPAATIMTFQPSEELTSGTVYTVSVSTVARDTDEIALSSSRSISFQVGSDLVRPTIVGIRESGTASMLTDNYSGVYKDSSFSILFDEPMNPTKTRASITLLNLRDSTSVVLNTEWNPSFTEITMTPQNPLTPLGQYRFTITTGARDPAENSILAPYHRTFNVDNSAGALNSNFLSVLSATKAAPDTSQPLDISNSGVLNTVNILGGPTMQLQITFSHSLDLSSIGDNIFISKILGTCIDSPRLTGVSFHDSPPGVKNRLRLDFDGLSTCEYEIKLLGGQNEIRSVESGQETGTWMQNDFKLYVKGQ